MGWDWKGAFDSRKRGPSKERIAIGGGVLVVAAGLAARQVPAVDLAQARREDSMGYVRLIDPKTRRVWELPLEAYDPTVGGYRNPVKPDLLLQKAPG